MKRAVVPLLLLTSSSVFAAITVQDLGTAAPPSTLGSFPITLFPTDSRSEFAVVDSVPSPLGGEVVFSSGMDRLLVGSGWGTWSHGYSGDVYATFDTSVTLELPSNTCAFVFYAQPDFPDGLIRATAEDGSFLELLVAFDSGANGYGFFTDGTTVLSSIEVLATSGFGIGEFGIATCVVPESSNLITGGVLAGGMGWFVLSRSRRTRVR